MKALALIGLVLAACSGYPQDTVCTPVCESLSGSVHGPEQRFFCKDRGDCIVAMPADAGCTAAPTCSCHQEMTQDHDMCGDG